MAKIKLFVRKNPANTYLEGELFVYEFDLINIEAVEVCRT